MKKVFAIFAIAGMLVACGGNEEKKAEEIKEGAEQVIDDAKEGAEKMMDKVDTAATDMVDTTKKMMEEAAK